MSNRISGSTPDRVMVFIDGNNLYHGLKNCGWGTWINVGAFAKRAAGNRELVATYYYNAPPRDDQASKAFFAQLGGAPNVHFRESRLQAVQKYGAEGPYWTHTEKGADTYLAADLMSNASADKFDIAIIVSSDGDFEPPAREVSDLGKRIEVLYFRNSRPFIMQDVALMREIRRSLFSEQDRRRRRPRRSGRRR